MSGDREFVDLLGVLDVFCSGCANIEDVGHGMLRCSYYVINGTEKVIVAKLIIAAAAFPEMREMANASLAKVAPDILPELPRLPAATTLHS